MFSFAKSILRMFTDCQCLQIKSHMEKNFPWTYNKNSKIIKYGKGTCPVAEDLLDNTYMGFGMFVYECTKSDINLIIKSLKKVWSNLHKLK